MFHVKHKKIILTNVSFESKKIGSLIKKWIESLNFLEFIYAQILEIYFKFTLYLAWIEKLR